MQPARATNNIVRAAEKDSGKEVHKQMYVYERCKRLFVAQVAKLRHPQSALHVSDSLEGPVTLLGGYLTSVRGTTRTHFLWDDVTEEQNVKARARVSIISISINVPRRQTPDGRDGLHHYEQIFSR